MGGERFRVTPETILEDTIPMDERIARTPAGYTIKGLYFTSLVKKLGPAYDELAHTLREPARGGRYVALHDYPQSDHARLAVAVARLEFPDVPMREALRRLERRSAVAFAESAVGRVLTTFASDPLAALRMLPTAFRHMQTGGSFHAVERSRGIRLELRDFAPWVDCSFIGAIEGAVVLFGRRPVLDVELLRESDANYDVDWT